MADGNAVERRLRKALADGGDGSAHPAARPVLWACVAVVVVFVAWAAIAKVDEVARGEGKVVPNSRLQVIQSLEGGILRELLVKEGDIVSAGQPLAQLDDTRFASFTMESSTQVTALKAAIARLE
ncbi:MAG: biotin/lipoyl-binding protein, partial [Pseudomonadota bacterium]